MTTERRPIRWGLLGTGNITRKLLAGAAGTSTADIVAVGSRDGDRATAFAAANGIARAHGSYEALLADPEVDAVYISLPNGLHHGWTMHALAAGKHVLCEKPLTLNAADAERMLAVAREHDRFLMEAMWTACHPTIGALRRRLAAGEFGTPRHFHAELGFVVDAEASDRMLDPALGASALLDMGIYPLTVAHLLFGEAESLKAVAATRDARAAPSTSTSRWSGATRAGCSPR